MTIPFRHIPSGTDAAIYDLEAPIVEHLLNSHKLIKNHVIGMESNPIN
jgi:hypothetical protein